MVELSTSMRLDYYDISFCAPPVDLPMLEMGYGLKHGMTIPWEYITPCISIALHNTFLDGICQHRPFRA